ncbi:hypothetical protein CR513_29077, partial [Mucuna pruriens]
SSYSSNFLDWQCNNNIVVSWILNSLSKKCKRLKRDLGPFNEDPSRLATITPSFAHFGNLLLKAGLAFQYLWSMLHFPMGLNDSFSFIHGFLPLKILMFLLLKLNLILSLRPSRRIFPRVLIVESWVIQRTNAINYMIFLPIKKPSLSVNEPFAPSIFHHNNTLLNPQMIMYITLLNKVVVTITGIGTIKLSSDLILCNVIYVPQITFNLLFVGALLNDSSICHTSRGLERVILSRTSMSCLSRILSLPLRFKINLLLSIVLKILSNKTPSSLPNDFSSTSCEICYLTKFRKLSNNHLSNSPFDSL